jgi:hypothetical protein
MMNALQLLIILLLFSTINVAQIIPEAYRIQWTAGIESDIPQKTVKVNVGDFGAAGDGITDDATAFLAAINTLPGEGGQILIPEGSYLLKQSLTCDKSVLFKGEGTAKTRLYFNLGGTNSSCIVFSVYDRGDWETILSGYSKGSRQIIVTNPASFKPGDFVEIQQENDADIMYTNDEWNQSWAQRAVGQICMVEAVANSTLTLNKPLYITYTSALNPEIRTAGMIRYPGVEDVYIERLDAGDGHTVQMRYVAYGRVLRIESAYTYRTHIYLSECYGCEIRNNYLHHSHDYGGGGHGYGVDLISHSTDNLVIDNVFRYLRHSMMTHVGSSGNVFAYNYSTEREPQRLCDISLHGHYGNFNLFESNVVEEINIADYWGPMGPGNTFLRNKITQENLLVRDQSHHQNLIGNVLTSGRIDIASGINGTLAHGNDIRGQVFWDQNISDRDLPVSYFFTEKPSFLAATGWPLFGPDVAGTYKLPAQERFERQVPVPPIPQPDSDHVPRNYQLNIYPNPFNSGTHIVYTLPRNEAVQIKVFSITGQRLYTLFDDIRSAGSYTIEFRPENHLASGLYFIVLNTSSSMLIKKAVYLK